MVLEVLVLHGGPLIPMVEAVETTKPNSHTNIKLFTPYLQVDLPTAFPSRAERMRRNQNNQ